MDLALLRNFGVAAHIDAGKTTVSERMLFHTGVERRAGAVDDGTAVLDWMAEERERGITISSAATRIPWRGHELNLIDTPGHVDFTVEVERCMRVLDGGILVLDAVVGVQAQSETVWRQMERHAVPAIAFVNKCDRAGADFLGAVATLETRLGVRGLPIQFPVLDTEGGVRCLIDLVGLRAWTFPPGAYGCDLVEVPLPDEVSDEVGVLRSDIIETLADDDEELLALVLEDEEPSVEQIRRSLRRAVIERRLVPVLAGAALRDIGVRPLLDAVVDYLPSPLDLPPAQATRIKTGETVSLAADPEGPPAAMAFKLHAGPHGDLTFVRVYSGTLVPGMTLHNSRTGKRERIARVLRIHADDHQSIDEACAGDIVGLTGLKSTGTGDTLCSEGQALSFEELQFPEPVITRVIEPEGGGDRDRLRAALEWLMHEDPTFHAREDDSGQWVVSGMGELHLEVVEHRLAGEFRLALRVGEPRVSYREAVMDSGQGEGVVDRLLGGSEVFARVRIAVTPNPEASAPEVHFALGAVESEAVQAVLEEALRQEMQVGPRFGFQLSGAKIEVLEASTREGRASDVAFSQGAVVAVRQALPSEGVRLEEPQVAFEIQTPAEYSSGIIADLNSRRAGLAEVESDGELRTIRGLVALSAMFGYSTAVRSLSQGRASFSMTPQGFRPVPESELEARGLLWH
ncbi:MAG: elongation factor G [Candidatus Paceibacteria bacterium]|jgi:elongation factor G